MASALGPIAGGGLLALFSALAGLQAGYGAVFAGISLANLVAALLAQRLAPYAGIEFSIGDLFHHRRGAVRTAVLTQQAAKGLWDSAFLTVWVLLMVSTVGSAALVSVVATAASLVDAASSLVAGHLLGHSPAVVAFLSVFPLLVGLLQHRLDRRGAPEAAPAGDATSRAG